MYSPWQQSFVRWSGLCQTSRKRFLVDRQAILGASKRARPWMGFYRGSWLGCRSSFNGAKSVALATKPRVKRKKLSPHTNPTFFEGEGPLCGLGLTNMSGRFGTTNLRSSAFTSQVVRVFVPGIGSNWSISREPLYCSCA